MSERLEQVRDVLEAYAMPRNLLMLALLLSACASDVRSTRLADVDLTDMAAVQELGQRLEPGERAAFTTFVVKHVATSAAFCGRKLVGPDGREPGTIGEAIELTLAREADERRAILEYEASRGPLQPVFDRWNELIAERDLIIDRQALLTAQHGPAASRLPEWDVLQARLAENGSKLTEIRPIIARKGN